MKNVGVIAVIGFFSLMLSASAETELPLPKENGGLSGPYEAMLGKQPVKIYAFESTLAPEKLREFYLKALPKQGWDIQTPPWAAKAEQRLAQSEQSMKQAEEQAIEKLEQLRKEDPDKVKGVSEEDVRSQVRSKVGPFTSQMQQARQMLARVIYAVRGDEHVLVNLSPRLASTGVFINRWEGRAFASPEARANSVNVCCTGETVPPAARKLPSSIPDYPAAKMIAAGSPAKTPIVSAAYVTQDPVERIEAFYHERMAYNGWTELDDREDSESALQQRVAALTGSMGEESALRAKVARLSFKNDEGMCVIAITSAPKPSLAGLGFQVETPAPQSVETPAPKTVILINFIGRELMQGAAKHETPRLPQ